MCCEHHPRMTLERRRQKAIGLKDGVEGQKDSLLKMAPTKIPSGAVAVAVATVVLIPCCHSMWTDNSKPRLLTKLPASRLAR